MGERLQRELQRQAQGTSCLNGEIFYSLAEAAVLVEQWRREYNTVRPHSACGCYLQAGVMANGVVMERHMRTPQGGPLSPLLANVLLDEVDQELELRGTRVCPVRR